MYYVMTKRKFQQSIEKAYYGLYISFFFSFYTFYSICQARKLHFPAPYPIIKVNLINRNIMRTFSWLFLCLDQQIPAVHKS